jgi:hypothetical protein
MRKPLLLILSAGCLISCHKDNAVPANNWTWFGTQNKAVYNYVLINANQVLTNTESDELHVGVSAAFIDSNNNQITVVRALTVNNQVIMPGSDSTYNFSYGSDQSANALQLFGSQVNVTIRGADETDTVSSSIYLPKQLSSSTTYQDNISRKNGMDLKWAPDPYNAWGNVQVQLFYFAQLSRKSDSSLPQKINTVNLTVPDNGSYHLSSADLGSFPVKAFIGITIARGTQKDAILPYSRKRIYYFTSASVSTPPVRISP